MVAIVGAVGDAAGELLRRMPCLEARCEDAVRASAAHALQSHIARHHNTQISHP